MQNSQTVVFQRGYLRSSRGLLMKACRRCLVAPTWRCTDTSLHTGVWRAAPDCSWSSALNTGCAAPSWSSAAVRGKPLHPDTWRETRLDSEWSWRVARAVTNNVGAGANVMKLLMTIFWALFFSLRQVEPPPLSSAQLTSCKSFTKTKTIKSIHFWRENNHRLYVRIEVQKDNAF